jgi:tRNA threonylcarbamoyladenosine biosynthesis protein TsaE
VKSVTDSASFHTASPGESRALGRALGERLGPGSFVALTGELGAGKTIVVQGIARGIGFEGCVSSPSFVVINEYEGRLPIYHVDLYRISDPTSLIDLGYREVFWSDGVTLVEWADRALELLPEARLDLAIEFAGPAARVLRAVARGEEVSRVLASLADAWSGGRADADSDD